MSLQGQSYAVGPYPGEARRDRVGAEREDTPPDRRAVQDDSEAERKEKEEQERQRRRRLRYEIGLAETEKIGGKDSVSLVAQRHLGYAAKQRHGADGDHDGGNPGGAHEQAVDGAARQSAGTEERVDDDVAAIGQVEEGSSTMAVGLTVGWSLRPRRASEPSEEAPG